MKLKKSVMAVACTTMMTVFMTACGTFADSTGKPAQTEEPLIAYFSYSGNTEEAAKEIADYTGGTLAEIQRATPYEDVNTEGEEELNSNARPEITISVDNVEEYDTIFVGYPIWLAYHKLIQCTQIA